MQNARAMQAEMDARMAKQSQAEDLNQNKTQNAVESPMMVDGWSYVPLTEETPITQPSFKPFSRPLSPEGTQS